MLLQDSLLHIVVVFLKFIVLYIQRILLCLQLSIIGIYVYFKVTCKESLSTLMFSKSLLCFSMLLIFCLIVYSFANTSLFSFFLTYNSTLSFFSFSKAPCKFWTNLYFAFILCLFMISISKSISKILVICIM